MRIVVVGQEEPVYFGPFLRRVIEGRHQDVVLVVIAGGRGAGSHPKTFLQKLENIYALWLIMEPYGFLRNLAIGLLSGIVSRLGAPASFLDKRSIREAAVKFNIPVIDCRDLNSDKFIERLKQYSPDVIINQTELLLKENILAVPSIGVINRHASLLPHFRGRLASWWSHAAEPAEYGVSIHFVDKEIDSGPVILQKKYDIDPKLAYSRVLDILFKGAAELMFEALDKIQKKDFSPAVNSWQGTKTYPFPSLAQIKAYRRALKTRRKG